MTEPREWTLALPWQTPPRSLNTRAHWRTDHALKTRIRDTVRKLVLETGVPRLDRVVVTLTYTPRDRRVRDVDNLVGTLKPAIDGLRDYAATPKRPAHRGVIADDDPTHLTWERPVITPPGPGHSTGRLTLTIREDVTP